jgi:dCMP deaminase
VSGLEFDVRHLRMAKLVAEGAKCARLQVGCILVDAKGRQLSTGYNGRARGLPNCTTEMVTDAVANTKAYPFRCPNSDAPSGQANGCESIHAEHNALLQCADVDRVHAAYVTHSPCITCVKLLMNTGCQRIVFMEKYPHADSEKLWLGAGRQWVHLHPRVHPFVGQQ